MELSLLLLSLAAGAQAWPQIPTDASTIKRLASLRSLPVIEETEPHVIEHVRLDERDEELPGFISVATQEKKRGLADEWLGNEDPDAPVHASRRGLPHVEETNPNVLGLPVEGRSLPVVHEEGPGVLGLPVEARAIKERGYFSLPVLHGERHPKMKRSAFEMTIENRTDLAYYAPLKIGNPPQEVYAQVDTGSYELWVDADCTTLTVASDKQFCEAVGQYEVSESKTSKALENKGDIKYGKGSATISYYTDDVAISDSVKIKNLQFGVASTSEEQSTGVLGLGKGQKVFAKYNTFLDELYEQGFTKTNTFSVGLGAKVDGAGVIAFGGVDTSKYSGNLVKLPIVSPSPDGVPRYWVNMKSISRKGKVFAGSDIPVFLDTGATLSLLPPALVESIANDVGTTGKDQWGFYRVDCSKSTLPGTIDFEFEGITIKVTFPEIIRQIGATCWLGLSPSTKFSLLGDTLMRSMYAVFDNDEDNIYLAQYKNCGSNIKTINKSSDIAGFKGTCDDKEDDGKDDEKSTSTTSSTPKTTAPPKSITTLITTTSGTSAITITSAVKPSAPASGPGSNPTPTPGGNPDVGGTGPSGETPEGSDDKGSDDKDGSSGSDDKADDSNKDGENDNSKDGDNNEEKDGGNGNEGGNGGNGGSAAGRVTPMGVLASAIVGVAIMAML